MMGAITGREQSLRALDVANTVRFRRAEMKRDLRAGDVSLRSLLTASAWWLESMKVLDLLMAQRFMGRTKASRLLAHAVIPLGMRVGDLTDAQRARLLDALALRKRDADRELSWNRRRR